MSTRQRKPTIKVRQVTFSYCCARGEKGRLNLILNEVIDTQLSNNNKIKLIKTRIAGDLKLNTKTLRKLRNLPDWKQLTLLHRLCFGFMPIPKKEESLPTTTPQAPPADGIQPFTAFQYIETELIADTKKELVQCRSESEVTQQLILSEKVKKEYLKNLGASDAQIAAFEKTFANLRNTIPPRSYYGISQKYNGGGG